MSIDEVWNDKSRLYFWNDWNLETHRSFSVSNSLRSQQFCELLQLAQKRENWVNFTDDEELDKLIKDDLGEKRKNKKDKSVPDEPKQPEKQAKKAKLDPAKGHMDIRSCMAVAAQEAAKAPEVEPIEIDDFPPDLISETNLEQIYSQVLTCAYEKNIEMGYRIEKYMTPKPLFPIQIPKFDTNLNVEFLFETDFIQNLNIGVIASLDNTELLSQTPKFPPEEFRPQINNLFDDSDGFNIDDHLYDEKDHTDSKNNQQKTNMDKSHNLSPDIVFKDDLIENEMLHYSNLKDELHNDVIELSPDIVGIDDLIEDEMPHNSNLKLKDELHNDGKELSPDIVCIDDIEDDISNNSLKDKHNDFKELSPDIVCIDDLSNESIENFPKPEDKLEFLLKKFESLKNQFASPKYKFEMPVENLLESKKEQKHSDSKSSIVSSTPKPSNLGKTFKKNILPKAQSEELDLFVDDTDNDTPKAKKRHDYPIFSKSTEDPVIVLVDSDEEFQEALKLSQKETSIDPEPLFEEDMMAIRLSQMEAERPSFQNLPSTSSTFYHPQTGTLSNYVIPKPSISTRNHRHCNNAVNVFSQQVEQDSEHQKDSFCVDTDEEEAPPELSLLEIAERKLAKKRKERILEPSSSSSKCRSKEDLKTPELIPKRRRIESDTDNDTPKAKKRLDYPIFSKSKEDPVIVLVDSDEESHEALKLSQKETSIDPEPLFEEDLKKAIRLSQTEAERPSFQNLPSTSSTVYHPQMGTLPLSKLLKLMQRLQPQTFNKHKEL